MRRVLLLTGTLLALLAPPALAVGGVNINWGPGCWSDGTPVNDIAFACNRNTGTATMTCSFALFSDQPQLVGIRADLQGLTEAVQIPAWWQMGAGQCRSTAISTSENFLSAPQVGCLDMWANRASGGLVLYDWGPQWGGDNRAHMSVVYAVPSDTPIPLDPDVEYYACQVMISYEKTIGAGSCAGCMARMVWSLCSIRAEQADGSFEMLQEVLPDGNQCLRWQHTTLPCSVFSCPDITPVRDRTWGELKSLYR
jgi:hypothetical protein